MAIDLQVVGRRAAPFTRTWSTTESLLYALGVGAGQSDPATELAFTTENSCGISQQVLPTFAVPLVQSGLGNRLPFGDYPRGALVHAEQALTVHQPLATSGAVEVRARITGIYDKRSGALVRMEAEGADPDTGQVLVTTRLGYFIRGLGGFGGPPAPAEPWRLGGGVEPDLVITTTTRPDQALLYRLCGDRNPLHSDPTFARSAGFDKPILHGLCTYGVVARELIRVACDGDPSRMASVSTRFSTPVYPGQTLTTSVWLEGPTALFQTRTDNGIALDRGHFEFKSGSGDTPETVAVTRSGKETDR